MFKSINILLIFLLCQLFISGILFSQAKVYDGPDDPAGDIAAEREGYMTGNRVFLYFRNTTELSDWPKENVSRWPNNYEGVKMTDGIGLMVGAVVYIEDDTIPVTDPDEIKTRDDLEELYYLQTSYREAMDTNPTGDIEWGFYPVFGYFNENNEYPAMSNKENSWPLSGWPYSGTLTHWPGEWDGRFGRGVIYADLETYFVVNDAQDLEYLGPDDEVKYYPRPGVKIGDMKSDVTIQYGEPWGGLGIRVEQRGFQWNNPQARDAIFWEYTIANISDYDITKVAFGYWVDNAIGSDSDDELGYFDSVIDMAYSWDINGIGKGGLPTGTMGFAYLESPGMAYDLIDNDEDGLIDEKRDNKALVKIGPYEGITNLTNFLDFYHLDESDLKEHWDADEDQDWEDGIDKNNDGVYQANEFAGDDVGVDGVGPTELNYTGPDEGECNHKPDYSEEGCEPNFAVTDVSESDMIGLTSFMLFPIQPYRPPYTKWFRNDESMWEVIGQDTLIEFLGNISNLVETFASGPFPLYAGRTERISMSELHSYDPLVLLNAEDHSAPALYELKKIVQIIYEKDYRFAQPPKMPTLTATPVDGAVILTWDDIADTRTRDPFLMNINDFEGYKLFRATDKKMADAEVITDGYGTPMFKKPIFQCDLIDDKKGFTDFGLVNGMGYFLGNETGIVHHFVDNTVQNGKTYYYGIVAYDYGIPEMEPGISPSENNVVIELDEAENVSSIGQNVQVVTPHQMAAGYIPPTIEINENISCLGTGVISPQILSRNGLKFEHTYKITFDVDTLDVIKYYDHGYLYVNNGFHVFDITDTNMVYEETLDHFSFDNIMYDDEEDYYYLKTSKTLQTDIFSGMRLTMTNLSKEARWNYSESGWFTGQGPILVTPTKQAKFFPWDYDVVFTGDDSPYVGRVTNKTMLDENNNRIPRSKLLTGETFDFQVVNKNYQNPEGGYEEMDLVVHDLNEDGVFDKSEDRVLVGAVNEKGWWAATVFIIDFRGYAEESDLPEEDDVYRVKFRRPFTVDDEIQFTVREGEGFDEQDLKETMKEIKVVPNPYVSTNSMEPAVANTQLNQRRRLMFTHIPARCMIKIFTVSGQLVDEIDVQNSADNGIVHWDLLTKEGLEVAAGMYIYYIKSQVTGDEKFGKFAIIK